MMGSRLEGQALRSAAHLIAALADPRFGPKSLSGELRDSISVLRDELDSLGLLAEYRQGDGSLAAWRPEDDANVTTALRRASFKDDRPSDLPHLYRVAL